MSCPVAVKDVVKPTGWLSIGLMGVCMSHEGVQYHRKSQHAETTRRDGIRLRNSRNELPQRSVVRLETFENIALTTCSSKRPLNNNRSKCVDLVSAAPGRLRRCLFRRFVAQSFRRMSAPPIVLENVFSNPALRRFSTLHSTPIGSAESLLS